MPVAEHRPRHPEFPIMEDGDYVSSSSSSDEILQQKEKSYSTSNRRVLTHVLARKERDAKHFHELLRLAFSKLDQETQRATDAERRAADCLVRARNAIDARALAEAEAARTREELGMYKVEFDQAQREIHRAQEILDDVDARRREAEDDAARARSVTRRLQEERSVELAREEGRRAGWRDGVKRGWRMGWEEAAAERRVREGRMSTRPRRSLQEVLFEDEDEDEVAAEAEEHEDTSDDSSLVNIPSRGIPEAGNGFGHFDHASNLAPQAPAAPIPTLTTPFRLPSPEMSRYASTLRRHRTPEPFRHRTPDPSRHQAPQPIFIRSRTPISLSTRHPAPEPGRLRTPESRYVPPITNHSVANARPPPLPRSFTPSARTRPYVPHSDEPSDIHPVPVYNASPSPLHRPISVPQDGFIPYAEEFEADAGRASIRLPPPHELAQPVRGTQEPIIISPTPEGGSPAAAAPEPAGRSGSAASRAGKVKGRDYAYNAGRRPPSAPPSAVPQRIAKEPSTNSRASTHFSEYDLLAPMDHSRSQSAMGRSRPPPARVDDELEYSEPPRTTTWQAPPFAFPVRRRAMSHSHGPRPPREIVFPAPLAPPSEGQALPPPHPLRPADMIYHPHQRDSDDFSPQPERSRPYRSRTSSSGVIGITVQPPSPDDSPPSPDIGTLITQPDLLSPEHAHRILPLHDGQPAFHPSQAFSPQPSPLQGLSDLPLGFVPTRDKQNHRHRHSSREREHEAYETAPIPPGLQYPGSPLAQVASLNPGAVARPGASTEGGSGSDTDLPLSPLNSDGLKSLLPGLPGRGIWRRFTSDK
ncbi:hypothetical protein EW146_g8940 [Bondarzewia mesenterica]|uniref:Uncharacterized protein n=1 Tax=Bondarzewia mesenterica TaxID=1095465 RepID=A0A4V3XD69_9AGAM|nr:hypothetical protein EW146_g8940 [Bondarzewia mesenterica]